MAESKEELKRLLMKVKEESEKAGLELNVQKTKIMASGLITSWQMQKQWKQWQALFFFGAPKALQMVTAPPSPNPSQHQSLFQWVNSSHEVAKVLEFQL